MASNSFSKTKVLYQSRSVSHHCVFQVVAQLELTIWREVENNMNGYDPVGSFAAALHSVFELLAGHTRK
jgi:hypothetical protein